MNDIVLSQFYNPETLNIFSDASIVGKKNHFSGCYGVVAVCEDNIIDDLYRLASHTTNNESELKGLRGALILANKWKSDYSFINIFSDSQISVFGLRDYIYNWRYNQYDGNLYGYTNKPIVNQEIFIESHQLLADLQIYRNCIIRIFHQSGHVDNGYYNLKNAAAVFAKSNNISGNIDLNFIRYISTYNNYVDVTSRNLLKRSDLSKNYIDPVDFRAKGRIQKGNGIDRRKAK